VRAHYFNTITDQAGNAQANATITVYLAGTDTLATIYDSESGGSAVATSQVTTNSSGYFEFWVDTDDYDELTQEFKIVIEKSGLTTQTIDYINIFPIASHTHTHLKPSYDSTTAFQLQQADGTYVFNFDSLNKRIGVLVDAPLEVLDVDGSVQARGVADAYAFKTYGTFCKGYGALGLGASSRAAFAASVSGDAYPRVQVDADGTVRWGSGSAATDVALKRYAQDILQLEDHLRLYANKPGLRIAGSEAGAKEFRIVEDAGVLRFQLNLGSASEPRWFDFMRFDSYASLNRDGLRTHVDKVGKVVLAADVKSDYFEALEQWVRRVEEDASRRLVSVVDDTSPQLGGDLDLNSHTLLFKVSLPSDGDFTGIVFDDVTAGEAFTVGQVGYFKSDGKVWKADADAEATTKGLLMMATGSVGADAQGTFLWKGTLRSSAFSYTTGDELYVSTTPGVPTATRPSGSGDVVRICGWAVASDTVVFVGDAAYAEVA